MKKETINFDLDKEAKRLYKNQNIYISTARLLGAFVSHCKAYGSNIPISLPSNATDTLSNNITIRLENIIGYGELIEDTMLEITPINHGVYLENLKKGYYTLTGRWLSDEYGIDVRLVSIHIANKIGEV